jgi:intein/homing endonuclease
MYEHFWPEIKHFLRKFRISFSIPYTWDEKGNKFFVIKNHKYVRKYEILTYVIYGNMFVMAWNLYQVSKKESNEFLQVISVGITAATMFMTVNRWIHHKGADQLNRSNHLPDVDVQYIALSVRHNGVLLITYCLKAPILLVCNSRIYISTFKIHPSQVRFRQNISSYQMRGNLACKSELDFCRSR